MGDTRLLPVPDGLDGERLDVALGRLFGLSRTVAAELIDVGRAQIVGGTATRSRRVHAGELLEIELPDPPAPAGPPRAVDGLTVVHEDTDLIVVDKPVGVAAHPSPGWTGPTITEGLAAMGVMLATSGAAERQGIVHRLDVGTTGLMVVAKSETAYSQLKQAFRERTVDKTYGALVQGHPDPSRGTVDAPIGRHPGADYRFAVMAGGRDSVTHYETVEAFRAATLLDIHLETGRTHQIRVHMSALRHPLVGDTTYGADPALAARLGLTRQWLHARALGFVHPGTGQAVRYESSWPADLARALAVLADSA